MERVCESNRDAVERRYEVSLQKEDLEESSFYQFMIENFDEVCPAGGVIAYEEDKVKCSLHKDVSDDDKDEIPWL